MDQRGKHHADAQKIADVGEMHIEIPTDGRDVIKDAEAGDEADKTQGAINGLENQLCRSVFDHMNHPSVLLVFS